MKIKSFLLISISALLLTSCASNKDSKSSRTDDNLTISVNFTSSSGYSDKGIVYTNEDNILCFYDVTSGYETALCSKPNCKHEGASISNPNPTCDGYVEGQCFSPAIFNDKLYFLYTPETKDGSYSSFGTKVFCQANTDCTERKEIAKINGAQTIAASIYNDNYYACAYYADFDEHGNNLEKRICAVSVINTKTGDIYTTPYYEEYQGIIRNLSFDENGLVFAISYTTENIDFSKQYDDDFQNYIESISKCDIIRFKFSDKKTETIYSDNGTCADIAFGYALLDKGMPVILDLNSCKETSLDDKYSAYIMTDKGALLLDNTNLTYVLYDTASGGNLVLNKADFSIDAVTDSYIFVIYDQDNDTFLGLMDKVEFLSGRNIEIKKLKAL